MTSGQRVGGVLFEDLFDPDIVGDGPVAPGYRSDGQPLRFANIKYGSKGPNVGRRIAGSDLSNLWAAKGTAQYDIVQIPEIFVTGTSYQPAHSNGHAAVQFTSSGNVVTFTNDPQAHQEEIGKWLVKGVAADFDVRFTKTAGNVSPQNLDQWLNLAGDVIIGFDVFTYSTSRLDFTVQIRKRSTGAVVAERTGNLLSAQYRNGNNGSID